MKRAYLDQKDYLRMAAGLGGDARYARDAEVFEKLTAHVQADGIAKVQAGEMEAEPSERLAATLRDRFIASLRADIARLADRHKFSKDDAEAIVRDDALRALPSASVVVSLFREHYRRHVGPIGKVRKADANDVMDMHHLRSLPYVDFQATDAFWADCARGTAKNFGTRLTKNTVDLLAAVTANL